MASETWSMTDRIFCHFGLFFASFNPTNNPQNQNFKKKKKTIKITFYTCVPHMKIMMYGFWDMECDRQNFFRIFSHFGSFLPFYLTNNLKNENFEKMKKTRDIIILQILNINENHMMYDSWDMDRDRTIFCSPWQPKQQK